MTCVCMGDIRLTPRVVEKILQYQRKHPYSGSRILIVSIADGRLILTIRSECVDLSHTQFIYPIDHNPQYDSDYKYLYMISIKKGKKMTKDELEMYGGDVPIETRIGTYWNVILVRGEEQIDIQGVNDD